VAHAIRTSATGDFASALATAHTCAGSLGMYSPITMVACHRQVESGSATWRRASAK
jgi:hypothetical protein